MKKLIMKFCKNRAQKRLLESAPYFHKVVFLDKELEHIDPEQKQSFYKNFTNTHKKFKTDSWPTFFILDGELNYDIDIQVFLTSLQSKMQRNDRLAVLLYNPYLIFLSRIFRKNKEYTFITNSDFQDLLKLSRFELIRKHKVKFLGISTIWICYLKSQTYEKKQYNFSLIIPARNEEGNITRFFREFPQELKKNTEVIFVEGHSKDNTLQTIENLVAQYKAEFPKGLVLHQQTGVGKANAVEEGIAKAQGEILAILDADLTVKPIYLPRFYNAYTQNLADFINGSRLIYPIEGNEMKLLNKFGNVFFSKALSFVLSMHLSDTLCGTKLFSKVDYERFMAWRECFGKIDPFGDFDLLFPASQLNVGTLNLPIHYFERTYGQTNIFRFRHGFILLKMTLVGFLKIKLGKTKDSKQLVASQKIQTTEDTEKKIKQV